MKKCPQHAFVRFILATTLVLTTGQATAQETDLPARDLHDALMNIRIRVADFRDAFIGDVATFLSKESKKADTTTPGMDIEFRVTKNLKEPSKKRTTITLTKYDVSLKELLALIVEQGTLKVRYADNRVILISSNPLDAPQPAHRSDPFFLAWKRGNDTNATPKRPFGLIVNFESIKRPVGITSWILPDTYPLSMVLEIIPTSAQKNLWKKISEANIGSKDSDKTNPVPEISFPADKDDVVTVTVTKTSNREEEPFELPHGDWKSQLPKRIYAKYRNVLTVMHSGLLPRRIPVGKYDFTVRCRLTSKVGTSDPSPLVLTNSVKVEVVKGSPAASDGTCFSEWLYFLHRLAQDQEAVTNNQDKWDVALDSVVRLKKDFPSPARIHEEEVIGEIAYMLGEYETAYAHLARFLAHSPKETTDLTFRALGYFRKVSKELGKPNPIAPGKTSREPEGILKKQPE